MKVEASNPLKPIVVAIIMNTIIAISKGIGFLFSGSSAMLSETIHSIADVMNQALLLLGIKRGQKGETDLLNYGHSQERFFWNLISAMGIFVLGCGVTVYHGVHDLLNGSGPLKGTDLEQSIIIIILFISLIAELYSFKVAANEIKIEAKSRNKKFLEYLNESIDPSVSAVFFEDAAAILGIALALLGIILTKITGNSHFDAISSILIGLLMGWIAFHLSVENKKFLVDCAIPQHELNQLIGVMKNNKKIMAVDNIKSVVLGPDRLKLRADIELDIELVYRNEIDNLLNHLKEAGVKDIQSDKFKEIIKNYNKKIYSIRKEVYKEIEGSLAESVPTLKHIDLV